MTRRERAGSSAYSVLAVGNWPADLRAIRNIHNCYVVPRAPIRRSFVIASLARMAVFT